MYIACSAIFFAPPVLFLGQILFDCTSSSDPIINELGEAHFKCDGPAVITSLAAILAGFVVLPIAIAKFIGAARRL